MNTNKKRATRRKRVSVASKPKCLKCNSRYALSGYEFCEACAYNAAKHKGYDDDGGGLINNYSTRVDRMFKKIEQDKISKMTYGKRFYGIELEYEFKDSILGMDVLRTHQLIKNFAALKSDSSISRGFEIVSTVADYEAHKNMWREFFDKKPDTLKSELTCGCHIHVSNDGLTDLQIGKLLCFVYSENNRAFITMIAGRDSSHHNNFMLKKHIKEGKNRGRNQSHTDRHQAINCFTANNQTIEFRLFKSPDSYEELMKNLDFVRSMVEYTTPASGSSIASMHHFNKFIDYVVKNKSHYKYLYNHILNNAHKF